MLINPEYDDENSAGNSGNGKNNPLRPDSPTGNLHDFFIESGHNAERDDDLTLALNFYEQAVEERPDSAWATYYCGNILFHLKRPEDALPFFQSAILLLPDNAVVNHLLGITLSNLNHSQEGVKYLRKATRIDPQSSRAWYDLGLALARLKQRKRARARFHKALSLEPDYSWTYYDLACLDALERKPDAAFQNLEQAIARGFNDITYLQQDTDLRSLHRDARWKEVLVKISGGGQG